MVEAIGAGVNGFEIGQRVAALTVYGAFAECLFREAEHFLYVPNGVPSREAAAVVLNYGTAWQMIHRVAKMQSGQTALVTLAPPTASKAQKNPTPRVKICRKSSRSSQRRKSTR
jgi:NADPH:quinone reductase-like Zn-dependent oxidoreductase